MTGLLGRYYFDPSNTLFGKWLRPNNAIPVVVTLSERVTTQKSLTHPSCSLLGSERGGGLLFMFYFIGVFQEVVTLRIPLDIRHMRVYLRHDHDSSPQVLLGARVNS
jgi:hypothetical protein